MSSFDVVTPADLLDTLPVAVVLIDADRRITGWNPAAEALYGHRATDVVAEPVLNVLFDTDDRGAASAVFDAVTPAHPWEGDFRVRRQDGALLVSSFRFAAVAWGTSAWIATDGIDQGLAEQERSVLLSAERAARSTAEEALGLVEAILASAPVGIAVFDVDLRYVRVNDAYAALSGVPASDHVGSPLGDVAPLHPEVAADLRRVVTTGRTILGRQIHVAAGADAGHERYFTASCFPVRTATGSLVGAGLTLVEITQAKRAEAERAALLRRAEAAHQRLSILATASTVLTSTMELDELLARLARVLTPTAADWCVIELLGPAGEPEHVSVSHRDRAAAEDLAAVLRANPVALDGNGPVAQVVRTGQAFLATPDSIEAVLKEAAKERGVPELAGRFSLRSGAVVPIEARGTVHGVLILSTDGDRLFDDDDLDLAVEIAHRAALAVGNARAFQQEHQIAESLQRALLPATVPSVPGLQLAVRYLAATGGASVGGDWYDVLDFGDGTTGIVVGDIVGHDIAASTSMGQLRSVLRAFAVEDHGSPSAALARVDRLFEGLGLPYATCILGVLDPSTPTLRWSNAGHPPPLLLRDGDATFLTGGSGVLLGVTAGKDVEEATVDLREGDLLVLYTDGLVERRGESLAVGLERLATAAASAAVDDAEALCDALLETLLPTNATREDDLAILVARVQAEPRPPGVHRLDFEPVPESAALTRGFAAGVLHAGGWASQIDTAVLLVSELVTNAVRHARGPCALVVTLGDDTVEVAVEDGEPRPPTTRSRRGLEDGGRGLVLVDALAHAWGVRSLPDGKATWFTLARR